MTKICSKCKEVKPLEEFNSDKSHKDGKSSRCRPCSRAANNARRSTSEEKAKQAVRDKKYRENNKEKIKAYRASKYERSKEQSSQYNKEYREKNKEKIAAKNREYREKNREELTKKALAYRKKRRAEDPQYCIKLRLRARIASALKYNSKSDSTINLLGCTIPEFKVYLEGKFTEGMTWDKLLSGEIHIDHVKPCASFDLTNEEEQRKCFHYTNLQPLWAADNIKKGSKLNE